MFAIKYLFVLLLANQAFCALINSETLGNLCILCQDFTYSFGTPNAPGSSEVFSKSDLILPFHTKTNVNIPVPEDDIVGISVTVRALFAPDVDFDLATTTVTIKYSKLVPATSVYKIKAYAESPVNPNASK